jgi:hypothetical protein
LFCSVVLCHLVWCVGAGHLGRVRDGEVFRYDFDGNTDEKVGGVTSMGSLALNPSRATLGTGVGLEGGVIISGSGGVAASSANNAEALFNALIAAYGPDTSTRGELTLEWWMQGPASAPGNPSAQVVFGFGDWSDGNRPQCDIGSQNGGGSDSVAVCFGGSYNLHSQPNGDLIVLKDLSETW